MSKPVPVVPLRRSEENFPSLFRYHQDLKLKNSAKVGQKWKEKRILLLKMTQS